MSVLHNDNNCGNKGCGRIQLWQPTVNRDRQNSKSLPWALWGSYKGRIFSTDAITNPYLPAGQCCLPHPRVHSTAVHVLTVFVPHGGDASPAMPPLGCSAGLRAWRQMITNTCQRGDSAEWNLSASRATAQPWQLAGGPTWVLKTGVGLLPPVSCPASVAQSPSTL